MLKKLVENAKQLLSQLPDVEWIEDTATPEDIRAMEKEAMTKDPFDTLQLKRNLWKDLKKRNAVLACKSCGLARVIYVKPIDMGEMPIPWKTWGRIFQWFALEKPVRLFFFMTPSLRRLPFRGEEIGSECVNGGYTLPCRTDGIVVYRYEEATRVLIHELFHAACTDNFADSTEIREAKTETWAELTYCALLSGGQPRLAARLWDIQSRWIVDLNRALVVHHGVRSLRDYVARYTLEREVELRRLGVALPIADTKADITSCRFTALELEEYLVE